MKKLLVIAVTLATALVAATSAEARDRDCNRDRGHGGYSRSYHRHGGYEAPRYCAPRPYCPPPVYYAPRYCAPRPACPPRHGYGYGYGRPSIQLSFGYVGRPGGRW
jgi:hypothetical protein